MTHLASGVSTACVAAVATVAGLKDKEHHALTCPDNVPMASLLL